MQERTNVRGEALAPLYSLPSWIYAPYRLFNSHCLPRKVWPPLSSAPFSTIRIRAKWSCMSFGGPSRLIGSLHQRTGLRQTLLSVRHHPGQCRRSRLGSVQRSTHPNYSAPVCENGYSHSSVALCLSSAKRSRLLLGR